MAWNALLVGDLLDVGEDVQRILNTAIFRLPLQIA